MVVGYGLTESLATVSCDHSVKDGDIIEIDIPVRTINVKVSDGVFLFSHTYGCSQLGDDHINTRTMLQNMVHHPNAGAVLVIGLGCENNQVDAFREN